MISTLDSQKITAPVDIAIFIKSYSADFRNVARLLNSIADFNRDGMPIYLCVPDDEISLVQKFGDICDVTVVPESFFTVDFPTEKIHGRTLGYLRQQIIKLSVHQIQAAKHYVILDSDAVLIRPFYKADFLNEAGINYTVLVEDLDQFVAPWYRSYADRRKKALSDIATRIGLPTSHLRTCHGNVTFSAEVLQALESWCRTEGLSPSNLMEIGPYEFSWYNFFLQWYLPERVIPIEPFIRYVHVRNEFRAMRYQGVTLEDLKRGYVGICLNSNWSQNQDEKYFRQLERKSMGFRLRQVRDLLERIYSGVKRRIRWR